MALSEADTRKPRKAMSLGEWLKLARKDWERAKRNLIAQDPEAAGFFLQQTVEKYLKALLQFDRYYHICIQLFTENNAKTME